MYPTCGLGNEKCLMAVLKSNDMSLTVSKRGAIFHTFFSHPEMSRIMQKAVIKQIKVLIGVLICECNENKDMMST